MAGGARGLKEVGGFYLIEGRKLCKFKWAFVLFRGGVKMVARMVMGTFSREGFDKPSKL